MEEKIVDTILQNEEVIGEPTLQEDGQEARQPEDKPFRLMVKFNHNELELDEENARVLAQKGLNYDKVKAQLDSITANEAQTKGGFEDEAVQFFEKYPEVKAADIPESVMLEYQRGIPLSVAFEGYLNGEKIKELSSELEDLKAANEIKVANEGNSVSATGSISGFGAVNTDDIYTEEELNSLNQSELSKNLDKALKSMTFWSQKRKNQ
jgi:hypothetical protein